MLDVDFVTTGCLQREFQCVSDIVGFHGGAQFSGNNAARIVVEDCRQVESAPAYHFQISEVGLPKLVDRCRLIVEFVGSLYDDERRTCDEIEPFEHSIHGGL